MMVTAAQADFGVEASVLNAREIKTGIKEMEKMKVYHMEITIGSRPWWRPWKVKGSSEWGNGQQEFQKKLLLHLRNQRTG